MADIGRFVSACANNNISKVGYMISAGMVDVNARNIHWGYSGLYIAMRHNNTDVVTMLLSCTGIRLDTTESNSGMTGLHTACHCNSVESVRLFLAHPDCTKDIVTMRNNEGQTAEMVASNFGNQDCVRSIKEFMDKDKTHDIQRLLEPLGLGDVGVEPVMLEGMTLAQIGDAIEKITAMEQTMEEGKNTLEVEQQKELDKLQAKHVAEKDIFENYCSEKKTQKQMLQVELQQRLQAAQPVPPASLIPECPICMESMRPPLQIFNCSNGHLICSICRPRVGMDKCHCEALYVGRATAMEQMVRQILGIL